MLMLLLAELLLQLVLTLLYGEETASVIMITLYSTMFIVGCISIYIKYRNGLYED